jgi:hypothetical protein
MVFPPLRRIAEQRDRLQAQSIDWRARNDLLHVLLNEEHFRSNELMLELTRLRRTERVSDADAMAAMSWVFILTYGRSGSTLLQGVLNSVPGVLVRGENGGMLTDLWHFQRRGLKHRDRFDAKRLVSPRHPWYGIDAFPVDVSASLLRVLAVETVMRPSPDTRVCGFKEIDWPAERLDDYIDFLREVFPGARFIVNTRDLDATAASSWWARRPNSRQELAELEARYLGVRDRLGDDAFHVRFDQYVANAAALAPLFEWLGVPVDLDVVTRVLAIPHSYDNRPAEDEDEDED